MARNSEIRQEIAAFRQSLFDEGTLDDMFIMLEHLEKNGNPNFVEQIMTTYLRDSTKYMEKAEELLDAATIDVPVLSRIFYNLNRSTASVGARKVSIEARKLKEHGAHSNWDCCKASLQVVKREHAVLKGKIETYFQMMRRAGPEETAERPESSGTKDV